MADAAVTADSRPRIFGSGGVSFGCAGIAGYGLGGSVLTALAPLIGADRAWCCGWLAAATLTWILNRRFTFRCSHPHCRHEWLRWLRSQALGGLVGGATFHLLMHSGFTLNVALALSTGVGACFNYFAGRSAVRSRPKPAVENARES